MSCCIKFQCSSVNQFISVESEIWHNFLAVLRTCIVASKSLCSVEHTFTKLSNGVFHLEISGEVAAKKLIYTSWLAVWS